MAEQPKFGAADLDADSPLIRALRGPGPNGLTADQTARFEKHYRPLLDLIETRYVTAETLADRWCWSEQHLANLRRKSGEGPAWTRIGRSIRYTMTEALRWEILGRSDHVTPDRLALAVASLPLPTEQRELIEKHLLGALFRAIGEPFRV